MRDPEGPPKHLSAAGPPGSTSSTGPRRTGARTEGASDTGPRPARVVLTPAVASPGTPHRHRPLGHRRRGPCGNAPARPPSLHRRQPPRDEAAHSRFARFTGMYRDIEWALA